MIEAIRADEWHEVLAKSGAFYLRQPSAQAWRARLVNQGNCWQCGAFGIKYCDSCRKAHNARKIIRLKTHPTARKMDRARERAKRKERGTCNKCMRQPLEGKSMCERHLLQQQKHTADYRKRKALREAQGS